VFCWCEIFFAVYSDGTLCMDVLQDKWSPCQNVSTILTSIQVSGAAPPYVLLVDSPFVVGLCDEWFGSFWPMFPMGVNNNDSKMLDWGKLNYELCLLRCITKCYAQNLYMYQVWIWLLTPFSLPECGFLWQSLLTDPNPASPANPESAQLYQSDIQAYNRWAICIQFYCSSLVVPVQRKKIGRADLERELLIWVIDTHKVMNTLILGSCLFWFGQNCLPLKCYCVVSSAVS
jgi:hypothetical protein